ncbi:sensor histidine kinase [Psychrobacter sp. ANT_WB68]|uniref:sensor histidine kinase n=1 Tax=Psychrobacter sp. ANT_WB68 TaxID=2597355 RepID=UPI0011F2B7B0|nr:HAMP domain-containing sensor histidine kinase [Psychrobacter sp. ANT_WB68]KAA0914071.1 HAMP domain-containing histidine kinase [Psychrobacter sp. ANT_WB68]
MNNRPPQTLPMLIWQSIVQTMVLAVLAGFLLSFVYGLVQHYKEERQHTQQLANLLTVSAASADGDKVVAEQVRFLLEHEQSIEGILFYTTSQPIADSDQSKDDWKNALFANTVSFNYPVIGDDVDGHSTLFMGNDTLNSTPTRVAAPKTSQNTPQLDSKPQAPMSLPNNGLKSKSVSDVNTDNALVGYINITLDVATLRSNWLRNNLWLWVMTTALAIIWALFILRKLNWPSKDIAELTEVCDIVIKNPELEQLPVIPQRFKFQELVKIKQAFTTLFNRLQESKQDYEALAAFEQQLHQKDLSLDVQLHNFQSMITHELKTSLNAIVGGLQLLDDEHLNDEQKDAVDIIHNGSDKLVLALDQIIQLNQIQKGQISLQISEFNPLQLIADLLADFEPIARQKGLALISHIHHIDYSLEGDTGKIQQILSILLSNAIKFTPVGQVSITSQLTHFDNSNRWQIRVKDTGIGIDSSFIDDIFNPFFQVDSSQTRQYEGTGIGLPVVKQMTQLMGASIDVDSTLGVGTEFIVTIPIPNQSQSRQQQLLTDLVIVYYYYENSGALVDELQRLGARVICYQHEQLVIDEMEHRKVDMVMFAEDVLPSKAELLAKRIRASETDYRALLVFWYPQQRARHLDSFEHGLKAAGVDYCQVATYEDKALSSLLKSWLAWS